MIDDLTRTLEALLDDPALNAEFPELFAANVVFERPDDTFTPQAPASLDLFLYDIRENLELRNNEPVVERVGGQVVIHKPPRRIDCSYLVTAWPTGGPPPLVFPEHQLLGQALQALGRHPTIPAAFLQGSLVGQEPPLPMMAPQIDGLKSPADFWTAMGNELRASFTVTVTISLALYPDVTGPAVSTVENVLDLGAGAVTGHEYRIGGRVLESGTGAPISDAEVLLVETGQTVKSNALGQFTFGLLSSGNYTLEATRSGFNNASKAIVVPGASPTDYDIEMSP